MNGRRMRLRSSRCFLGEGVVAVDAGANIGTHALAFARHVGACGRVFAFEPQSDLFQLLQQNLRDNSVECVDARCAALSDRPEILYVPYRARTGAVNSGAVQLLQNPPTDQAAIPVHAAPLDDLLLDKCDLLKADVEGMELRILEGAASTLRRCGPVLYLECNTVSHAIGIFEYLRDKSYRLYLHKSPAFNPANFFGSTEQIFGAACESSILAVPFHRDPEYAPRLSANIQIVQIGSIGDLTTAFQETSLIDDLRKALAHAERLGEERLEEIRRYDAALAEAQQLVVQRDGAIDDLRKALAHAERLGEERLEEIRRYDAALAEAQQLVFQLDGAIDDLRKALAHAERLGDERLEEIRRYDAALAEAQGLVVQRDHAIDQLRRELTNAEQLTSQRNGELESSREHVTRLEGERLELMQRLGAIEGSFAWRVSKPLRSLEAVLRTRHKRTHL